MLTRSHAQTLTRSHAHTLTRSHAHTLTRSHQNRFTRSTFWNFCLNSVCMTRISISTYRVGTNLKKLGVTAHALHSPHTHYLLDPLHALHVHFNTPCVQKPAEIRCDCIRFTHCTHTHILLTRSSAFLAPAFL